MEIRQWSGGVPWIRKRKVLRVHILKVREEINFKDVGLNECFGEY